MEKLEGYNSRINKLSELVAQLESGKLSLEELSEMETITRELHERSIILRYNAFKDQVMPEQEEADASEGIIDEDGGVEVEVIIEEVEEEQEEAEEDQTIDFSIFDDSDEDEEAEIEEPAPVVEEVIEPEPEPEIVIKPEPIVEAKVEEPTPVVEKVVEPEPEVRTPEPEVKTEEPVTASAGGMTPQAFLDKMSKVVDDSLASRFTSSKLDSLIGAFGLNQRLRYINDLFDGSSEIFSDAIKSLDAQSSLDDARMKAAHLATDHEWDPEEEVVIEFMSYVNRRYA